MKSRALSMLLIVAMVVTALPLVALPAVALGSPEYTEEDYNALYVQDKLTYALDFYSTNEHWGGTVPQMPHELTSYIYSGVTYNFTNEDDRVDYKAYYKIGTAAAVAFGTYETRAEAEAAIAAKKEESEELAAATYTIDMIGEEAYGVAVAAYLDTFRHLDTMAPFSVNIKSGTMPSSTITIDNGMLSLYGFYYLQHMDRNLLSKMEYGVNGATMEVNRTVKSGGTLFTFGHARFYLSSASGNSGSFARVNHSSTNLKLDDNPGATITMPREHNTYTLSFQRPKPDYITIGSTADVTAYYTEYVTVEGEDEPQRIVDLSRGTYTVAQREYPCETYIPAYVKNASGEVVPNTAKTGYIVKGENRYHTGEIHLFQNGDSVYTRDSFDYVNTDFGIGDAFVVLWSACDGEMSALRYYAKQLDEDERAQNHLADILKWFRLDISYVNLLSPENLMLLAESAADFTFDSDRAEVAAVLEEKAQELAEAQYASSVKADALEVVAYFGLDTTPLARYPRGVLSSTYSYLLSLTGDEDAADVKKTYAEKIRADVEAYLLCGTMTAEEYDDLYVSRGLEFALDFFKSNSYWNTENIAYTVPLGASNYTKYEYKGVDYDLTKDENRYGWGVVLKGASASANTWYNTTVYATEAEAQAVIDAMPEAERSKYAVSPRATAQFLAAVEDWWEKDKDFLAQFEITPDSSVYFFSYKPNFAASQMNNNATNTAVVFSVYTMGDGYIQLRTDYHTSGSLQVDAPLPVSNGYTMQLTAALGGSLSTTAPPVIFHNARPIGKTENGVFRFNGMSDPYFTHTSVESVAGIVDSATETVSLSYTLLGADVVGGTDDKVVIRTEDGTVATYTGTYTKNTAGAAKTILLSWNRTAKNMRIYAYRHYTVDLTATEIAQNHFADLAKFFRLNLSGFSLLSDAEKETVYAAMTRYDLSSDRIAVQDALSAVMTPYVKAAYAEMKGEDTALNALVDVAAEYFFDLAPLLSATRDMSTVFGKVTAAALAGKSFDAAQEIYADAIHDAYYYLSYYRDGEEDWNSFLRALADSPERPNAEALMALPLSLRRAAASLEPTQAAIDAYVKTAMAAYADTAEDYNALYVQAGLLSQIDFFKTNRYWNEAPTLPTAPIVDYGEDALFKTNKYIVIKWDNANKAQFSHFYEDENGAWQSTTSTSNPPVIFTDIEGGATAAAQAEEVAASLRTSLSNPLIEAVPYPGNTGNEGVKDEYQALIDAYKPAVNAQLAGFVVKGTDKLTLSLPSITYKSYHDQLGTHQYAPFTYGDGYLQMNHHHANSFLLFNNTLPTDGVVTGEMIATSGNVSANHFMQLLDVTVRVLSPSETGFKLSGVYEYQGIASTNFAKEVTVPIGNTVPFSMGLTVDRDGSTGAVSMNLHIDGASVASLSLTDTKPGNCSTQLGYSSVGNNNRVYALRYYDRALTAAEYAQNHFADLAKYFRLELAPYKNSTDAGKAAILAALADFTLASDRATIVAAYEAAATANYSSTVVLPEAFFALAKDHYFDLSPILALTTAEAREAASAIVVKALNADFPVGYATDSAVMRAEYLRALAFLDSIDFFGTQVRVSTVEKADDPLNPGDMPGIRQIFKIGEAELYDLVKVHGTVTFGATIHGESVNDTTLTFTATLKGEELEITGGKTTTLTYGDDEFLAFVYTVTYDGFASYEPAVAEELYGTELSYRFFLTVDGVTYTRDAVHSIFGDAISATEVYQHFYDNSEELTPENWGVSFAEDAIVRKVLGIPQA